ncbi:MAG TPA: DUF72 domain-containing protein, partial [Puia sp.]|nr:DUF72 domain-containing protein [Puia sp.]
MKNCVFGRGKKEIYFTEPLYTLCIFVYPQPQFCDHLVAKVLLTFPISFKMYRGVFRSGTSGLVLSEPGKLHFPPEFRDKHRLIYYASKFNSIEINSSFYKIPLCRTYKSWSDMVPAGFQFTIKLWQGITHEEIYDEKDLERF